MKGSVLLVACAAIALSCPAYGESDDYLTVKAPPSLEQWAKDISRSLDATMRYPAGIGRVMPSGIVSVSFRCSEAGKPTDVTVIEGSKFRSIDIAAVRAIENLKSLHPLPAGMSPNQIYQADLFFAERETDLLRMKQSWSSSERVAARSSDTVRFAVLAVR